MSVSQVSSVRLCGISILSTPGNAGCVSESLQNTVYYHATHQSFFRDSGQVTLARTCLATGPGHHIVQARAVYEVTVFPSLPTVANLFTKIGFSNHSVWQADTSLELESQPSV